MKKSRCVVTLFLLTLALSTARAQDKPIMVALVGDSTVTHDSGWGKAFAGRFNKHVKVLNFSAHGRSSKSFYDEKRLAPVLEAKPDYILIQFGHNDQPGKGPERETDPDTTYRDYLKIYINEARRIGAQPIVISSAERRLFVDGKALTTLGPWAEAAGEVAAETKVPFVDLYTSSLALYNRIGGKASAEFNLARGDRTHFNKLGAEAMMDLIVADLKRVDKTLAAYLNPTNGQSISPQKGPQKGPGVFSTCYPYGEVIPRGVQQSTRGSGRAKHSQFCHTRVHSEDCTYEVR